MQHELDPPSWVVSSGRPFRFRCSSCGHTQSVRPLVGIEITEEQSDVQVVDSPFDAPVRTTPAPGVGRNHSVPPIARGLSSLGKGTPPPRSRPRTPVPGLGGAAAASWERPDATPANPLLEGLSTHGVALGRSDRTPTPGGSDPAIDASAVFLKQNGQIYMVRDWHTLRRWIAERRVDRNDLVSEGGVRWEPVSSRSELLACFPDETPVPQPVPAESPEPGIGGETPFGAAGAPRTAGAWTDDDTEGVPIGLPPLPTEEVAISDLPFTAPSPASDNRPTVDSPTPAAPIDEAIPLEPDDSIDEDDGDEPSVEHQWAFLDPPSEIDEPTVLDRTENQFGSSPGRLRSEPTLALDDELIDDLDDDWNLPRQQDDQTALYVVAVGGTLVVALLLGYLFWPADDAQTRGVAGRAPVPPSAPLVAPDPVPAAPAGPPVAPAKSDPVPAGSGEAAPGVASAPAEGADAPGGDAADEPAASGADTPAGAGADAPAGAGSAAPADAAPADAASAAPAAAGSETAPQGSSEPTQSAPAPAPAAPPRPAPRAAPSVAQLVNQGWARVESGDLAGALGMFDRALERSPRDAEAHYGLGYAYRELGQPDRSRTHLCQALANASVETAREVRSLLTQNGLSCE